MSNIKKLTIQNFKKGDFIIHQQRKLRYCGKILDIYSDRIDVTDEFELNHSIYYQLVTYTNLTEGDFTIDKPTTKEIMRYYQCLHKFKNTGLKCKPITF